jgi:hypothetical protein
MAWWVERYRRVGTSSLVDEIQLPNSVSDEDIAWALRVDGEIRLSEWPVKGALGRLLRQKVVPASYMSWWRRIYYVYFLGYRVGE